MLENLCSNLVALFLFQEKQSTMNEEIFASLQAGLVENGFLCLACIGNYKRKEVER